MASAPRYAYRLLVCVWPLLLPVGTAAERLVFEVQNGPHERFRATVQAALPPAQAELVRDRGLVEIAADGSPLGQVPFALDQSEPQAPILAWLAPGITAAGQLRRYALGAGPETPAPQLAEQTDLQVTTTDTHLVVRNTYFEVHHPLVGHGGFPDRVAFALSGNQETRLSFLDRLHSRELSRGFSAEADAKATARLAFQGPTRVVVETSSQYAGGNGYAPGGPRAVYRYVYSPFSPVIDVAAVITREDDRTWDELHFLEVSRADFHYTRFLVGDPFKEVPMNPPGAKSKASGGAHWAAMATDDDAVGAGYSGVACWDASNEFVYYVSAARSGWATRRQEFHGGLYFGPAAADPEWYSAWIGPGRQQQVRLVREDTAVAVAAADEPATTGAYVLENDAMRLVFADSASGLDCVAIENRLAGNARFVHARPDAPGLWRLELRPPVPAKKPGAEAEAHPDKDEVCRLDNRAECVRKAQLTKPDAGGTQVLTLTWTGLDLPGEVDAVDVTATVRLGPGAAPSEWRLQVRNRSQRLGLWTAEFPFLPTVCPKGAADVVLPGGNWGGRLVRQSRGGASGYYPSAVCPTQFLAFNLGEAGLYLGAHDGEARAKHLTVTPEQDATVSTFAENMGVPGASEVAPFPVIVAAYRGDWWEAARIYRQWALGQAWSRKGPLAGRNDVPRHFAELGFWMLGGGELPVEVKPWMIRAEELFAPLTVGLHWYCWHVIPFDNSYPEYFPTKPDFGTVVRELVRRQQVMMPYINGRLWDRDIPSFAEGIKGACKQRDGEPYTEMYGSGRRLAPMCPTTGTWQDKVNEVVHGLIADCGVNAIYLDQIGAAAPALCFDASHGHPLGGGKHWVDGYRQLLDRVKAQAVAGNVALTTENTAEPYLDNIEGFLAWNPRYDTDIPLLPAVYSGYTIYFTSPQSATDDLDAFVAAQGRDFLWGCQLGWNGTWILDDAHRAKALYQKQLCALRLAAKDYLVYGRLLDEVRPRQALPNVTVTWNRNDAHLATLPGAMATLWQAADGSLAVFLVNLRNEAQRFAWTLDPRHWAGGGSGATTWVLARLTPEGSAPWRLIAGRFERTEFLEPREVRALTLRPAGKTATVVAQAQQICRSAAAPASLRAAAAELLFDQVAAAAKLEVRLAEPVPTALALGEPVELILAARNQGRKDQALAVAWADGRRGTLTVPGGESAEARHVFWPTETQPGLADAGVVVSWGDGKGPECRRLPVPLRLVPPVTVTLGGVSRVRGGESFLLPVEVRNHSRTVRRGRIEMETPKGWRVEPSRQIDVGKLSPGARRDLLLKCVVPSASATRTSALVARFVEQAVSVPVTVLKSRPVLSAVHFGTAPKIDGQLGEWATAEPAVAGGDLGETVKIQKDYGGAADCSAQLRAGWDAAHLYVAAEVTDNVQFQDADGFELWRGDCIQLAFRNGPPNPESGFDGTEYEVGLAQGPKGPVLFQWMPGKCPLTTGTLAVMREGAVTRYEAAIPWTDIGLRPPRAGQRVSWSFTVNDNDGAGFRGWLEWTPGICGSKDSSAFGWLGFAGQP